MEQDNKSEDTLNKLTNAHVTWWRIASDTVAKVTSDEIDALAKKIWCDRKRKWEARNE